jgi:hypothetical protein
MVWAELLDFGGNTDWRLPRSPSTAQGYINEGEMGYLYYTELGNLAGGPRTNNGLFINIPPGGTAVFWLDADPFHSGSTWSLDFTSGFQNAESDANDHYDWAVHVGNIGAIPIPGAVWLLGSGLIVLVGFRKRLKKYILFDLARFRMLYK